MAAPNYSILSVEEADLPLLAKFVHASKLRLSINRLLFEDWPNETIQMKMYTDAVTSVFKDPNTECFKAVDTDSNEIIGYFVLARKRPAQKLPEYELGANPDQETPEGMNPSLFVEVMIASAEIAKATENMDFFRRSWEFNKLMRGCNILILKIDLIYICVEPRVQRHGVGAKLVQLGFDRAKAENIPFALGAEAPSHGFYVKLGFKETTHADIDLAKYASAHSGFGVFRLNGMIWYPHH
jgi:GNAT superfamily N-acetyltransferase